MVNGRPAAFVPACCLDRDGLSNLRGATRSPQRATGSFVTDAALSASSAALPRLPAFADARHMMFGSDFLFAPLPGAQVLHRQFGQLRRPLRGKARRDQPRQRAVTVFRGWHEMTDHEMTD
jgi:hypothetical protein